MIKIGHTYLAGIRRGDGDCGGFGELLRQRKERKGPKPLPVRAHWQRRQIWKLRRAAVEGEKLRGRLIGEKGATKLFLRLGKIRRK